MRVISGSARGKKLKRVPGVTTRPVMDRVKESLFNILGSVAGERWLDLFGGTGQVGIEALSRGADDVVFVDNARRAVLTIQANLASTGLAGRGQVVQADAFAYLRSVVEGGNGRFDLIYVAPPQYLGLWQQVMELLDQGPAAWLTAAGIIVVQIDPREYEPLTLRNFDLYDSRTYGNTKLCFYKQLSSD